MTTRPRANRRSAPAAPGPDLRYVDSGDATIAYQVAGDGDIPVFVLQPFWVSMDAALTGEIALMSHLARSCRIIIHDRRGTGASDRRPDRLTLDGLVDDIAAVLTDAGVEQAIIAGMGESAPLAVHFVVSHPNRAARLILIDPTLRPLTGPGSTMLLHTLRSKPRAGLRALARTFLDDDAAAAEAATRMARTVDGPTAAALYEAFLGAGAMDILDQIAAPTLLAYGVLDRIVSEDDARATQGMIPDARVGIVTGPAGSDTALREGWIQIRDFLAEARRELAPLPPMTPRPQAQEAKTSAGRRAARGRGATAARDMVIDYVPAGRPAPTQPAMPPAGMVAQPLLTQQPSGRPLMITWGPPQDIPEEAVALNRKGIDQLLIGEIEEALESFRKAVEIAPHYDDAVVNHRELLTRLVQRRVAEWQARQAEEAIAESERRAEQWARRARNARARGPLGRLLRRSA
jgi:pimeloyl-ACP methyl ester carboxylesterase